MQSFLNSSYPESDAAADDDREWFEQRPWRRFRVRPYRAGELLHPAVTLFAAGPSGAPREVNHVIVRQIRPGVRTRTPVYATPARARKLNDDQKIARFMRSRGLDPNAYAEFLGGGSF
jgi:hypothetical protein